MLTANTIDEVRYMESVWQNDTKLKSFEKLEGNNIKTDVLIIGAGLTGILSAYMLKQKNIDCVIAERDRVFGKTSSHTTAKITYQTGLIYDRIIKNYGIQKAQMYFNANKKAFDEYKRICKNIDCDYEVKDNYVYSINNRAKLEKEIDALSKIGYTADFCRTPNIPIKTAGAVCFKNQAQFNPMKFAEGIIKGLKIYENTPVIEIKNNTAITDCAKISANAIIVATHFPFINTHGAYFLKLYQHRSYALALTGVNKIDAMYVDESNKGFSFRGYKDYLILGGGGHRTGKNNSNIKELYDLAENIYPHSKTAFEWAAQDCMSLDGIPYIGRYSSKTNNLYVAAGYNKWGVIGSMAGAEILSDMISGDVNKDYEVFNPSRSILMPQLAINGIETVLNLITPKTRRCPHLGCALKWNKYEHSWDCACHGSRFDGEGKLLENPANTDIKA